MTHFARVFLAASVLLGITGIITAKPLPDTAKIIPPETAALINIHDVNSLQLQFQKTNLYKFYKDPAMAAFFKAFKSKWQDKMRESQDEISKMISDVNAFPSGRLAAAVLLNEKTRTTGEPMLLVVSQWGKNVNSVKTAVDKAAKKAVENGARQEKETIRGHEVITITQKEEPAANSEIPETRYNNVPIRPSPENFASVEPELNEGIAENIPSENQPQQDTKSSDTTGDKISFCFVEDVLVISEDIEVLKLVITRIEGGTGQSLADNENYQSAMKAVGPVHDFDIYINLEQIIKFLSTQQGGMVSSQLASYGIDNVTSLGMAAEIGRASGTPMAIKGLLKINGAKKGVMKFIEPQNASMQLPRFLDTSSSAINFYNISIKNIYDELVKMMNTISPGFAAMMNMPLYQGDENGKGKIELRKDILDYLGPQITLASSIKKPFVAGSDSVKMLTAIGVTDRAALERSLATLHSRVLAPDKPEYKRDILGQTVYVTDMSAIPFMAPRQGPRPMADVARKSQQEPDMPRFAFTVTDTYLILGTEENVTQAVRLMNNKDAGSIANMPWFVRAKSALPAAFGAAGLSDGRTYGEYFWWNVKEAGKHKGGLNMFDPTQMAISQVGGYFDFSLLPDFEKVKKYFGVSGNYLTSRPDGYYFEAKQLDLKSE